jgi:hypothetical protein
VDKHVAKIKNTAQHILMHMNAFHLRHIHLKGGPSEQPGFEYDSSICDNDLRRDQSDPIAYQCPGTQDHKNEEHPKGSQVLVLVVLTQLYD